MLEVREMAQSYRSDVIIRRWFAMWVDFLFALPLLALVSWVFGQFSDTAFLLLACASLVAYHAVFESLLGATPGKWFAGIRVVDEFGDPPRLWKSVVRAVTRLVEVNPLLLGGLPAGLIADNTKYRQRLGDLLTGVFVVKFADLRRSFPVSRASQLRGPESRFLDKGLR